MNSENMGVSFHIGCLPNRPMNECMELGRTIEALGCDGFWVANSRSIMRDAYTILSVLVTQTSTIQVRKCYSPFRFSDEALLHDVIDSMPETLGLNSQPAKELYNFKYIQPH